MVVNKLELINFRNYLNLSLNFNNKINFIVGENAEGKTNLVEGIYTLSLAKSFRTQNTIELIKNNEKKAIVKGTIVSLSNYKKIEIEFNKFGKKVLINSKPIKKISELNKILNVIYFIPKDVILLKDTPKNRRQFLDLSISKLNNDYLKNVINYEKILKERNDLLKTYPLNNTLFDILTDNLIELSKEIYKSRRDFIDEINLCIFEIYNRVSMNKNKKVFVKYLTYINDYDSYYEIAKKKFNEIKEDEFKKKQTLLGIQKDDFKVYLDDLDASLYGSQSENRLCVLSLKLANYFIAKDEKPVIILDDILSEFDDEHEKNLLNYLNDFGQIFITGCKKSKYYTSTYYEVTNKKVEIKE